MMRPVQTLLIILSLLLPISAFAQKDTKSALKPVTVQYSIYAGGIHALDASLAFNQTAKDYSVILNAKPYGVIGNLLPWGGNYTTHGIVKDNVFTPKTFDKTSQWREDRDSDVFVYENGVLMSQIETDNTKTPPERKVITLDPKLHENTVDILTGTAGLLQQIDANKGCDFSKTIYDGRRRYTLQFKDLGTENLVANDYNIFNGTAKLCEIEMIPIAGFPKKPKGYYKIQEEARTRGQLPRVWLGPAFPGGPNVPVKMMVKSEYGAVLIHLIKVTH